MLGRLHTDNKVLIVGYCKLSKTVGVAWTAGSCSGLPYFLRFQTELRVVGWNPKRPKTLNAEDPTPLLLWIVVFCRKRVNAADLQMYASPELSELQARCPKSGKP